MHVSWHCSFRIIKSLPVYRLVTY